MNNQFSDYDYYQLAREKVKPELTQLRNDYRSKLSALPFTTLADEEKSFGILINLLRVMWIRFEDRLPTAKAD
jgi:hypothetical protein